MLTPEQSVMALIQSIKMTSPALANALEFRLKEMARNSPGQFAAVTPLQPMNIAMTGSSGGFDWGGLLSTIGSTVGNLASTYVTSKAKLDEMKANIERAKLGQPPLVTMPDGTVASITPTTSGTGGGFGLSPLVIVGLGVAAYFLFRSANK